MTPEMFEVVLEKRISMIREVLGKKASEYARGTDRLHNFKRVAAIKRVTVAEANIDGFCKHLVSILDMVDDLKKGVHSPTLIWDEKLGDAINYLILLEAIIKEDRIQGVVETDYIQPGMEGL